MQRLHQKQAELGNLIWLRVLIQSMDSEQLIHLHLTLEDNLVLIIYNHETKYILFHSMSNLIYMMRYQNFI